VSLAAFRIDTPSLKWRITMASSVRVSVASVETIRFGVFADSAGQPIDPTTLNVAFQFLADPGALPADDGWTEGSWDVSVIGAYTAGVLVGPTAVEASALELAAGLWQAWIRIVDPDTDETVVRQAGQLLVA
jgi:hypothetical protein